MDSIETCICRRKYKTCGRKRQLPVKAGEWLLAAFPLLIEGSCRPSPKVMDLGGWGAGLVYQRGEAADGWKWWVFWGTMFFSAQANANSDQVEGQHCLSVFASPSHTHRDLADLAGGVGPAHTREPLLFHNQDCNGSLSPWLFSFPVLIPYLLLPFSHFLSYLFFLTQSSFNDTAKTRITKQWVLTQCWEFLVHLPIEFPPKSHLSQKKLWIHKLTQNGTTVLTTRTKEQGEGCVGLGPWDVSEP